MKAIDILHAEIGIVTSRPDNSVSFRVITPEITASEAATLITLHGKNARVTVIPADAQVTGMDEVTTEAEPKSKCSRLRAVLFLAWKNAGSQKTFNEFYDAQMERYISHWKEKLPEQS